VEKFSECRDGGKERKEGEAYRGVHDAADILRLRRDADDPSLSIPPQLLDFLQLHNFQTLSAIPQLLEDVRRGVAIVDD
jgi:hypothetical protein